MGEDTRREHVNDTQILTLAIAIVVPLALLRLSNGRLTDMRTMLQGSIAESKETLRAEIATVRAESRAQHTEAMAEIRAINAFLHEAVVGKLDELNTRLTALESRK